MQYQDDDYEELDVLGTDIKFFSRYMLAAMLVSGGLMCLPITLVIWWWYGG